MKVSKSEKFKNLDFTFAILIFMLIFIYAFRVNFGLDLSDSGYSLARYRLFSGEGLDNNFFLSNKIGSLILKINNSAFFLRGVSYAIYSIVAIISYLYWKKIIKSKFICMASSVISMIFALSFPLEILHNSITALLLFIIYIVFVKFEKTKDKKILFILSLLSVMAVFFRISNFSFILVTIIYFLIYDRKNVMYYIIYILIEIIVVLLILFAIGKVDRVIKLVDYLFFLAFNDTNHNLFKLFLKIFLNISFIVIPIFLIKKFSKYYSNKLSSLEEANLSIILILLFFLIFGYFTVGKKDIFLINSIFYKLFLVSLYFSFLIAFKVKNFKIAIFLFCALPFATANLFYYHKICMFLVMPIFLLSLRDYIYKKKFVNYAFSVSVFISLLTLLYLFPYRDEIIFNLKYEVSISQLRRIKTNEKKANSLNKIKRVLDNIDWKNNRLITNGSVPMFSYITDAYSVHNTTWSDLDSYSLKKYKYDIDRLTKKLVIIYTKVPTVRNYWEYDSSYEFGVTDKEKILKEEILNRKLKKIYEDEFFVIWN